MSSYGYYESYAYAYVCRYELVVCIEYGYTRVVCAISIL